jgi:hypothetical protein
MKFDFIINNLAGVGDGYGSTRESVYMRSQGVLTGQGFSIGDKRNQFINPRKQKHL